MRLLSRRELWAQNGQLPTPPPVSILYFLKGQRFDSVALPLYSSTKGQTTQCEALTEEKRVIWVNHGALTVLC